MPDILPVCLQNVLYACKPEMREERLSYLYQSGGGIVNMPSFFSPNERHTGKQYVPPVKRRRSAEVEEGKLETKQNLRRPSGRNRFYETEYSSK